MTSWRFLLIVLTFILLLAAVLRLLRGKHATGMFVAEIAAVFGLIVYLIATEPVDR